MQELAPLTDNWDWQLAATCRGLDVDAFYHPRGNATTNGNNASLRPKRSAHNAPSSPNAGSTP
jgi:hypothetical protein